VFTTGGKQFVTAATQDGRIHLVDAASMVGVGTSTVFSTSKTVAPSALATFEEAGGTRFILAPANGPLGTATKYATSNGAVTGGAIVAFKVVDQDGKTTLQPAWSSRDIPAPSAPIVVNGVVFVLATGEYTPPAGSTLSAALRAQRSTPAVLYALDAATGKELWNSGKAITSFSRAPLAVTASKIIVSTHDNTVYAFGYKLLMD
jgi:outer membrane protein assembly factor BamB